MATRKKKEKLDENKNPTIIKGSHLTVITHPTGQTELIWDDDALLNDVKTAINNYESKKKKN